MIRRLALTAVTGLAVVAVMPVTPARAASTSPVIQLLHQTPWVESSGTFELRLGLDDPNAAADRIQVSVYDRLITRTDFDAAANGHVNERSFYSPPVQKVSDLPVDSSGGIDVRLPVDTPGSTWPTVQVDETGVFPVQVALFDPSGVQIGDPLTTFLVYAPGPASQIGFNPLDVALVVPYSTSPVVTPGGHLGPPGSSEASRLAELANVLDQNTTVAVSVLASPETVTSMAAAGTPTSRGAASALAGSSHDGLLQVLPASYAPVSLGDLGPVGKEVSAQVQQGQDALTAAFAAPVDNRTWVVDGPLDPATAGVLQGLHAAQVIVPDGDLTPYSSNITFAYPTALDAGGADLTVMSADPGLSADFTRDTSPSQAVLAANILLAEMAMIQAEQPGGRLRAVVAMPPANWTVSPTFVETVLSGLTSNPLLTPVTASTLFKDVHPYQATRDLAHGAGSTTDGTSAGSAFLAARNQISALDSLLEGKSTDAARLEGELLMAESSAVSPAQRQALLGDISQTSSKITGVITLPRSPSITLTSTKGQIPLTILSSGSLRLKVELRLSSQRLIFSSFSPPGGTCQVRTPTSETCTFVLASQNTTLKVPVETRSSGVFPLDVYLYSAGGSWLIARDHYTVRSTAVSSVAIVLTIVAVVSLALWWGRDLRRGRRRRGLVPSPVGSIEAPAAVTSPAGHPAGPASSARRGPHPAGSR